MANYINSKQKGKDMQNKFAEALVTLIVKACFLAGGIQLMRMPMPYLIFIPLPVYQTVGTVILAAMLYIELSPSWTKRPKVKVVQLSSLDRAKVALIDSPKKLNVRRAALRPTSR